MTAPDQGAVPPFDPGNRLLAETPAQLTTSHIPTTDGQRLGLTIRTPSTTITILLSKKDARTWAHTIKTTADQLSSSGLIVSGPAVPNLPDGTGPKGHG